MSWSKWRNYRGACAPTAEACAQPRTPHLTICNVLLEWVHDQSVPPPKKNPCTTGCPAASLLVTPLPKTSHFQIWSWTSGSFMILIALIMIEGFIEVLFGLQVLEEALGEFEHHGHLAKESVSDSEVTITTHGTPMFLPVSRVSCTNMHCFLSSIFQQSLDFSPRNSFFWSL